jgi:hypothetical protein
MPAPSPISVRKSYDLYLGSGERRFVWTNPNHGVTLTQDDIVWTTDGRECQAQLRDVAEVHLQTGSVGQSVIASCRLTFSDEATVSVLSSNANGLQDTALDQLYVAFVYDLHTRLAALKDAQIVFTAGFSEARYRFGKVLSVVAGLFFLVMPTVLLLMSRELKMAWVLYTGVLLVWPLDRVMQANAPRSYDPQRVPPEVLPAQ